MNTKDLILEETLKLILKKSTIDISIRDIQDATGLTIGGIYYHFSNKKNIFEAILQKYMVDYIKIDFDKINLEGSSKEKIHDLILYILHHFINGVEIESIDEKINYREVILLLTTISYAEDNVNSIVSQTKKDIKLFLTNLVEEGKIQNEIRKDFSTKDIVESLYNMYMGVQYFWITLSAEDIDLIFEKNFNLTWQSIEYK